MDIPFYNVGGDNLGVGSTLDISDVNSSIEAIDKAT